VVLCLRTVLIMHYQVFKPTREQKFIKCYKNSWDSRRQSSRKTKSIATGESASAGRCAWENLSLAHYKFRVPSTIAGGRRTADGGVCLFCIPTALFSYIVHPSHETLLPVNKDRLPESTQTLLAQAVVVTSARIYPLSPEARQGSIHDVRSGTRETGV
jgi:hypothetical protein